MRLNDQLYALENFGKSYAAFVILVSMEDLGQADAIAGAITVSQLNRQVKTLLEQGVARLWIEGEISNLAKPASGHLYFSLKDDTPQVSCAFFRQRQRGPTIGLKDGDQVLVFGLVSIYEARGNFLEAQHYYKAADDLTIEPVKEISISVNRIRHLINKEKTAQSQIAK